MDDIFFNWSTISNSKQQIFVDVYEVVRPSYVCPGKLLIRHHTRFKRKSTDPDDYKIDIIKCTEMYITATFNGGKLGIPNRWGGPFRTNYLFSLSDVIEPGSGDAINADNYSVIYWPMLKFIEFMIADDE